MPDPLSLTPFILPFALTVYLQMSSFHCSLTLRLPNLVAYLTFLLYLTLLDPFLACVTQKYIDFHETLMIPPLALVQVVLAATLKNKGRQFLPGFLFFRQELYPTL